MTKPSLSSWRSVAYRLPALAVCGVAVFALAQNACSDSSSDATGGDAGEGADVGTPAGCRAGETLTVVSGANLCCAGSAPSLTCHAPGAREGEPCAAGDASTTALTQAVTLDVCITDACNGDRAPTTYVAKDVATTRALDCVDGTYQASGEPSVHEVERVCNDLAPLVCGSTSYGYNGYHTSYGYSYYGGHELMSRAVAVLSSTCTQGSDAAAPCDVGSL